jgi:hypothetical protein
MDGIENQQEPGQEKDEEGNPVGQSDEGQSGTVDPAATKDADTGAQSADGGSGDAPAGEPSAA